MEEGYQKSLHKFDVSVEKRQPLISIVIPAFNEQENIDEVLTQTYETAESIGLPYEIIVIDDGSTDETRKRAYGHKAIVLCNPTNQGKGVALQRGFLHARGDIVITMDSDGSHDPEDIKKLIGAISGGADVALGTRFNTTEGKHTTKKLHILGNNVINFSIQVLTGKRITDSQCGFRALRRKVLKDIELESTGYQVETELTVKSLRNGNVVKEVPLNIRKRMNGHSHLNPLADGLRIMETIIRSRMEP